MQSFKSGAKLVVLGPGGQRNDCRLQRSAVNIADDDVVRHHRHFGSARAEQGGEIVACGSRTADIHNRRVVDGRGGDGCRRSCRNIARAVIQLVTQRGNRTIGIGRSHVLHLVIDEPAAQAHGRYGGNDQNVRVGAGDRHTGVGAGSAQGAGIDGQAQRETAAGVRVNERKRQRHSGGQVFGHRRRSGYT